MAKIELTSDEFMEKREEYAGYCLKCKEWTMDGVEPDAEKYECPVCEKRAVYGAEELLILGLIEITE